jgi:hypothetical protein
LSGAASWETALRQAGFCHRPGLYGHESKLRPAAAKAEMIALLRKAGWPGSAATWLRRPRERPLLVQSGHSQLSAAAKCQGKSADFSSLIPRGLLRDIE